MGEGEGEGVVGARLLGSDGCTVRGCTDGWMDGWMYENPSLKKKRIRKRSFVGKFREFFVSSMG